MYNEKLVRLKERERKAIELCKRRQEELERQSHDMRQIHIDHIDRLKQTELEFKKHSCMESDIIKEEKERIKQLERELKVWKQKY